MIEAYLKHHIDRSMRTPYNGLYDCHVKGLHSIVLNDAPENRTRIFFTRGSHLLFQNTTGWCIPTNMSLAIHAHHCDVQLVQIYGKVRTDHYDLVEDAEGYLEEARYVSAIATGDKGRLDATGRRFGVRACDSYWLSPRGVRLRADVKHTVYVPFAEEAAWIVIEGEEDPDYESVCYTNNLKFDADKHYRPMTQNQITDNLRRIYDRMVVG